MAVKIFLGTVVFLVTVTITGLAYWFFPILNNFVQTMGGQPLQDPRGSWQDQTNTWLSFLPNNGLERAEIVTCVIVAYLFLSTILTMIAFRIRKIHRNRQDYRKAKTQTLHSYNRT